MLLLMEVTLTDKESQAYYSNYTDETSIRGELETKLGSAMKSDAINGELLIAFDHTGRIIENKIYLEDASYKFADRLFWITSDAKGEHPNLQQYGSEKEAEANYHLKRGTAMQDANTLAILTMIIENGVIANEYWVRPIEIQPELNSESEVETKSRSSESSITAEDINNMKLAELKELAKTVGLKGYSSMTVAELKAALTEMVA